MTTEFVASSPAIAPEGRVAFEVGSRVRFLAAMPWHDVEPGTVGTVADIWRGDDTVYWVKSNGRNIIVDDDELWLLEMVSG